MDFYYHELTKEESNKPWLIILNFLHIMLLPIMLNIMPMTTAIMPQFVYDFNIFND